MLKSILKSFLSAIILGILLFWIAGDFSWGWGWAFVILGLGSTLLSTLIMDRSLIVERGSIQPGTKKWDPFLAIFMARLGPMLAIIVAGLDHRYHWSPTFPTGVQPVALILAVLASLFVVMAVYVNKFFSGTVRIQTDRGHTVIKSWPYSAVRHPGYAGSIIHTITVPLILGSYWALIPAALTVITIIVRTALEDRTLIAELPGYSEYTHVTRYRLIPGIW